ncbi:MFS transporter [Arthrobacter sp. CAN_C5]|uniref:MFS transporter n=1 Tax=Arthrobacter sp. CAN_C5 TaxID=2760706 RepID=UPI001AE8AC47|nr:MFS transporter [Arthrobacter sp. CAN_C5]MBP2217107.1 FSR family fosmidomycin resistance protein-like MFS transporter [Arthrobacter sp. CAN_C5]
MRRISRSALTSVGVLSLALGAIHLFVDGLGSSVISLQAVIRDQTGAEPALLSLLVAVAFSSSSLLQPLGARSASRFGDGRVAIIGSALAAAGYGLLPAVTQPGHAIAAVAVGGIGSALFHPAAGALAVRSAPEGQESLPLAVFSAVGMAGSALVPVAVLSGVSTFGGAAAVPFAVPLVAVTVALLLSQLMRARPSRNRPASRTIERRGQAPVVVPVLAAALLALIGVTVMASAPLLLADKVGSTNPLLGYSLAAYGTAAAVGGVLLALWVRHTALRLVMLSASTAGILASLVVPHLPPDFVPAAMAVAGVGLSGSLPLLVTTARRNDETSAGPAVARILGLASGLGSAGYAGVGLLHSMLGYGMVLTVTTAVAGGVAFIILTRLKGSASTATIQTALSICPCGGCACSTLRNEPEVSAHLT